MTIEEQKSNLLGGIGEAFTDRNFRIFSVGSIGSWISYFVQLVAVAWLTWELTKSTTWLAAMALMEIVPTVLLMPFAGALADRYDRFKMMIASCILLLIQAVVMAVLAWQGLLSIWPLAGLVLIHGVLISFLTPAWFGVLPRFIDPPVLPSAIAVSSAYTQFAMFAGPAIAGWIIAEYGVTAAFVVNALGYLSFVGAFLFLRTPADYKQPEKSVRPIVADILDGFAYIKNNATIAPLLTLVLVSDSLAIGFYHMTPAYAEQILGMGIVGVSTILASRGLGATGAALWLAHGGAKAAKFERVLWATLIAMISLVVLVQVSNLYLAAAIVCLMGFAGETRSTATMTIVQLTVEEDKRGRVMGTMFMLSQLAAGIGAYLIGYFAVSYGLGVPTMVGVAIGVVVWFVIFLKHKRRSI